jgi:fructosamine-3-kinase
MRLTPEQLSLVGFEIGETLIVDSCREVPGGCINNAVLVTASSGQSFFIKSNSDATEHVFRAEAEGLRAIRETNTIRVPQIITFGTVETSGAFLVMEAIEPKGRANDFFETLGRQLAEMHRAGTSDRFGFDQNNWLGSSEQPNDRSSDWVEFWATSRLGFQLELADKNQLGGRELQQLGRRLIDRLDGLISSSAEPPSLIHGDLWSGNYMADERGQPVLIDPAVYYGNREAEFGMTTLFGGFPSEFYDAYAAALPLAEGWKTRVEIYRLYHLLNHLNLFGSSYLSGCLEILQRYAR